jgi:hypothetical protein
MAPKAAEDTISVKDLKECLDALERLKGIRRELKEKLSKQSLSDNEEVSFAENLCKISRDIRDLEWLKLQGLDISKKAAEARAAHAAKGKA